MSAFVYLCVKALVPGLLWSLTSPGVLQKAIVMQKKKNVPNNTLIITRRHSVVASHCRHLISNTQSAVCLCHCVQKADSLRLTDDRKGATKMELPDAMLDDNL